MIVSPYQFIGDYNVNEKRISYFAKRELGQGGPIIGSILIDGEEVSDGLKAAEFGGPFTVHQDCIIAPMLTLSLFSLVKIDVNTGRIISKAAIRERLILIESVIANTVFYYCDLENRVLKNCEI